jgi:hypothetical protein
MTGMKRKFCKHGLADPQSYPKWWDTQLLSTTARNLFRFFGEFAPTRVFHGHPAKSEKAATKAPAPK